MFEKAIKKKMKREDIPSFKNYGIEFRVSLFVINKDQCLELIYL